MEIYRLLVFLMCHSFGHLQLLTTFNIPELPSGGQDFNGLDGGEYPLLLTTYIEAGKETLGRKMAQVDRKLFLNVSSYSGYLTVDESHDSNLFFWFFPAQGTEQYFHQFDDDNDVGEDEDSDFDSDFLKKLSKRPQPGHSDPNADAEKLINGKPIRQGVVDNKPVMLWLQGGPGVSSLFALFTENGPFLIKGDHHLDLNSFSWHTKYHLLFIDNPVGTGFSYTDPSGYLENMPGVGRHLYTGLVQFFKLFPFLQRNDFFISGESYAGKYIPAIGNEIYEQNGRDENVLKINLKGLLLGNALSDPYNMIGYSDFAYQLGLIGLQGRREMQIMETLMRLNIDKPDLAKVYWDSTLSTFSKHSNYSNLYNIHDPEAMDLYPYHKFIQQPEIRRALHVGTQKFSGSNAVYAHLVSDFMTSTMPWIERLLDAGLRIMYYNGNWDFIVGYPMSENAFQNMAWKGAAAYRSAKRRPFIVHGQLKGYVTNVRNFYEVAILNAGHMVPTDQPEACLALVDRFIRKKL